MKSGGFILIAALAVLSVLAVLSMQYAQMSRSSAERTRLASEDLSGFYVAEAGVERVKAKLAADTDPIDALSEAWRDTAGYSEELAGWRISVRVTDEESKINLNSSTVDVLANLFEQFDMKKRERDVLAASLLDWIDSNNLHRTNGAESDYYKAGGFPYQAKNAPLDAVDELLRIRGAPADLLSRAAYDAGTYAFADCVTVVGDTRVNINTAPPPVLIAVGFTKDEVKKILTARAKAPWTTVSGVSAAIGEARYEIFRPKLRVASSWFFVHSSAVRKGVAPVSAFAILRRSSGRIFTAGFWS